MKDNKSAYNANVYDVQIASVLPYYPEYHWQIIDLVGAMGYKNIHWLDTGCGTGTLAAGVLNQREDVRFTLCDPSENMLAEAKTKLAGREVSFLNVSSGELTFDEEFEVVTAVQCHHYLSMEERRKAVANCYRALKRDGVFIAFENIMMSTDISEDAALARWRGFLADHGNSPEDIQMHIARRGTEVLPITIEDHIALLKSSGFRSVDLLWASYLQAGFWAIK